ncbi:hypothetical protein [Clostridium sp.]
MQIKLKYQTKLRDIQVYGPLYLEKGLGFFRFGIIDQHFDKKARFGRLVKAAFDKEDKYDMAFGVDENTALVCNNATKRLEVMTWWIILQIV